MEGGEYFMSLQTSAFVTENYVMVNSDVNW